MNNSVDIALIEPPSSSFLRGFPLGLSSLAAVIEQKTQYKAKIIDLQSETDWDNIKNIVIDECQHCGINIFGIRALTSTFPEVKKLSAIIKSILPEAVVIVGGPHVSFYPEICLKNNASMDIVVMGEGEETMINLMHAIKKSHNLSTISGITYRTASGDIVRNADRDLLSAEQLGKLSFKYNQYLPYNRYSNNDHSAIMITSRGCPFGCGFCSAARFWGNNTYRARPMEHVFAELEYLILHNSIKRIYFEDAIFNLSKSRVMDFCSGIITRNRDNPQFNFTWRPPCRIDLLDREMLEMMKASGCTDIFFGLETFDERQLRMVKGGGIAATSEAYRRYLQEVIDIFHICKEIGIETIAAMIMGLPYETEATFSTNIEMLNTIRPDKYAFSVLSLYAGAPLYYEYSREPGFEWLDDILSRDDMYDLLFIDNKAEESISSFSVHGSRAIKPRYVNKDVFYQTGMIEHNCLKIASDFDKYRHNLTDFDNKSLTMKNIKAFHSQRLGV
ncbi:MAG: radical SAM protein [Elusimicrobia bacterium]|nr:radical SAM protein [Elusimicrobiota bacterium]